MNPMKYWLYGLELFTLLEFTYIYQHKKLFVNLSFLANMHFLEYRSL